MTADKKNSFHSQFNATSFPDPAQIREQAERKAQSIQQPDFSSMTPEEIQQQFHELQVKKIETELQNEQLRGSLEAFKDVEKELFKNKNLLEGIIDGIPDVLAIQFPDHTIERYNRAGYDMLGMTPEEVVGRKCYELIGRERECDGCATRKALQSGKMEKTEKYVPELGAYLDCCSNPILDEEGNVVQIIEQLRDITLLKEQERKLKESEERLDLAMMVKNEGIWDWNLASNETVFDDRFYTMAGYTPNEFPQNFITWRERVHPDDLPNADAGLKACLSGESERYDTEFRFRHKDGSWIWIRGQGKVVEWDENGTPLRMVGTHTDITDRKKVEASLWQSEEKYRYLVENLNDIIYTLNDKAIITYISPGIESVGGYKPDELIGKHFIDFVHPADKEGRIEQFQRILSGIEEPTEYRLLARDGTPFWIRTNARAVFKGQQLLGIQGTLVDITERKHTEEALRKSENYYRAIFETSGTAMFIIDEDTTIPLVNSNFVELSGYSRQEIEGKKSWTEFVHPDDLAWMKENHYLRRQNPEAAPRHYEFRFINRRNEKRDVLVAADMIPGTNRSIASCIDITERKHAEEALRKSENYYRTIFETSGSAMFITEQDTTISHVNSNFEKFSGYSRDEVEWKKSWIEFVHSDDVEWMEKNHYARRREPRAAPPGYDFRFFVRNGELRQGFLTVNMIPDTTQSVISLIDITERKRAEILLRQSEAKLQTIIEAAEGFISTHNRQLRIEFMSKHIQDKIGRDATGDFCYKALWGFESRCPWCPSDSVFNGKTERLEYQNPKTGCWYYTIMSPIFDESGRVSSLEALTIDITERKREEIALAERAAYLDKENIRLKSSMKERFRFGDIIGKSSAMQSVYDTILKGAATDSNVVIYGETGTGKELVARAIHENSDRRDAPFVAVNCGAITDTLIESEFFGYKKGAFTGAERDKKGFLAMADGGTLFLDEIGEIGHGMQVKLLRVIEGYGYTPVGANTPVYPDIRLIAATHRDLGELVNTGVMREDFFYRIDVIPIHIPPLRERREDLPLLIEHFRQAYSDQEDLAPLTGEILTAIQNYDWPGNVRELQNVLDRYFTLDIFHSPKSLTKIPQPQPSKSPVDLREALGRYEKNLILSALENSKWRRGRAADRLGITRRTLYKKMKIYRID